MAPPPQPTARQYEQDWGPEDTAVDPPVQQEDVVVSPSTPQSSAPPPLRGFLMIDLVRMVLIGDNMEEFPIEGADAHTGLHMFCREHWAKSFNTQFQAVSKSLGLPIPEITPPPKKKRKGVA